MKSSAGKIALAGLNDLFQTGGETVQEVPLSELFPFKNHPFQVRDDEAMRKTVESIVRSGVLSPGIVRPRPEGGYEIIAGHRRKRGSELAGRETMPVLIRMLDDDEATIIMVDSNLQREKILPSEKAFAYKMKLEALKHQGQRTDLTSDHGGQKLTARERVAQDAGETSGTAVARYISLTKLLPPLLDLVDEERLAVSAAADYLSGLPENEQTVVYDVAPAFRRYVGTKLDNHVSVTAPGSYGIIITVDSAIYDNVELNTAERLLVLPKAIPWTATFDSKIYDGNSLLDGKTVTYLDVNGASVPAALSACQVKVENGELTVDTSAPVTRPVAAGPYAIGATITDNNYVWQTEDGKYNTVYTLAWIFPATNQIYVGDTVQAVKLTTGNSVYASPYTWTIDPSYVRF